MRSIIIATTSRYRLGLMDRLHVPYTAVAPPYEEIRDPALSPREQLEVHARGKALSVVEDHADGLVIGSDQGLISPNGELLGKPGTESRAVDQLEALSGHTVSLLTATAVVDARTGTLRERTDETRLTFRALGRPALERYVALDQPLDCAGSFKLESLGIALFDRIDGRDPTNVIGLPLMTLIDLLAEHGVDVLASA